MYVVYRMNFATETSFGASSPDDAFPVLVVIPAQPGAADSH